MSDKRDLYLINRFRSFQKHKAYKKWCLHYANHLDVLYNIMISRLDSYRFKKILRLAGESLNSDITHPKKEDFYAWIYANTEKVFNPRKCLLERPLS